MLILFVNVLSVFAQETKETLRFHMWASLDAYPELYEPGDFKAGEMDYSVKMLKETTEFLLSGMLYGWNFVYTPSDKARGVEEFFELTEIQSIGELKGGIQYESPWISHEDNRLNCWVRYNRDSHQIQNLERWSSIKNAAISGRGYGSVALGFDGIRKAAEDALKQAVREYYRNEIKNKPKEISGSVLIRKSPVIGIVSGRYVINLDFFLESGTIITYSIF